MPTYTYLLNTPMPKPAISQVNSLKRQKLKQPTKDVNGYWKVTGLELQPSVKSPTYYEELLLKEIKMWF